MTIQERQEYINQLCEEYDYIDNYIEEKWGSEIDYIKEKIEEYEQRKIEIDKEIEIYKLNDFERKAYEKGK